VIRVGVSRSGSSQKRSGAVVDKSYTGATRSAQAQLEGLLRSEVTPPVLESEYEFSLVDIHLTLTPLTPYELANWPSSMTTPSMKFLATIIEALYPKSDRLTFCLSLRWVPPTPLSEYN